jgi:hypothetical protein
VTTAPFTSYAAILSAIFIPVESLFSPNISNNGERLSSIRREAGEFARTRIELRFDFGRAFQFHSTLRRGPRAEHAEVVQHVA